MITAICNIYINSEIKLQLFKETFPKVYKISDNWLVYIRGKYREEVVSYIKSNFKNTDKSCVFFEDLFDNDWAKSTDKMLEDSKYDYIYVFLEDHFLMKPVKHFRRVISDMITNKIDYFQYSFFNIGLTTTSAEKLYPEYTKYFYTFTLDNDKIEMIKKEHKKFYPYSLASLSSKKYFKKLLNLENRNSLIKIPFYLQVLMENVIFLYPRNRQFWFQANKIFAKIKLRWGIYPVATPFNLEKSIFDCEEELLPLKTGGLKEELFANWDDDNGLNNSSLVKRGLYPNQLKALKPEFEIKKNNLKNYSLKRGEIVKRQYFPDVPRPPKVPIKYIKVSEGEIEVSSSYRDNKDLEFYILKKGEDIFINANISHEIKALQDSKYSVKILS